MAKTTKAQETFKADPVKAEPVKLKEYRLCPKCGDKSTGPYQDAQNNWRCNCAHPKCGFWDSMVYNTEAEAAAGWEAAGGPDRFE